MPSFMFIETIFFYFFELQTLTSIETTHEQIINYPPEMIFLWGEEPGQMGAQMQSLFEG